jgi:hypothetical protein
MAVDMDVETAASVRSQHLSMNSVPRSFPARRAFAVFLLLYVITMGGHYTSGDGFYKVQGAKQIISGGPYWIDTTTGNPPKYGIGHSLTAILPVALSKIFSAFGFHAEAALYTVVFALNGAFLLYLVAIYLGPRYDANKV